MSVARPKFLDSPFFIEDEKGWRLKEGAPKEVGEEFEEFMREEEGVD